MLNVEKIHHVAIIVSDYEKSKRFYTEVLGFTILREVYREGRDSYKLDLEVNGVYQIELFSFPNPPKRVNGPEAVGLRHLAFEVRDVEAEVRNLERAGVECETIRVDEMTGKKFTFFKDPDGLPLELYESDTI